MDAQKDKLYKCADYENMVVAGEYSDEGFSGKNIQGRHEFQRMMADIESGKLMISILSAVAEIERENIRTQTVAGREQKAREGKWNGGLRKAKNGKETWHKK